MFSRSHLLIEKEYIDVSSNNLWGIDVSLINDNLYEWSVRVLGPPDSPYEGGIFRIYVNFDEHYSIRPPRICFHTIPYHPNIDKITGRPCIDYLDNNELWNPSIKMRVVLLQIQNLLRSPVLESAVNQEAVAVIKNSYEAYKTIARECVIFSQKIDGGTVSLQAANYMNMEDKKEQSNRVTKAKPEKRTVTLSFDDYYTQWSGIATTKPDSLSENSYLKKIKNDYRLQTIHLGMTADELEEEDYSKLMEYENVYYGVVDKNRGKSSEDNSKLSRLNQMRKIYLQKKPHPTPRSTYLGEDSDGEVENLVAWTKNLNPEEVDSL